jgi:hypothetical protein
MAVKTELRRKTIRMGEAGVSRGKGRSLPVGRIRRRDPTRSCLFESRRPPLPAQVGRVREWLAPVAGGCR